MVAVQQQYECADCGAKFAEKKGLARHKKTACPAGPKLPRLDNDKRRSCPRCGRDMLARDVAEHIKRVHMEGEL